MSDDYVRCPCVVVSVVRLHHIPILLLVLVLVLAIVFFVSLGLSFKRVLLSLHLGGPTSRESSVCLFSGSVYLLSWDPGVSISF